MAVHELGAGLDLWNEQDVLGHERNLRNHFVFRRGDHQHEKTALGTCGCCFLIALHGFAAGFENPVARFLILRDVAGGQLVVESEVMIAVGAVCNFVVELAIRFGDRSCGANWLYLRRGGKAQRSHDQQQ